ncbi:hypothetical protein D3C86_1854400 [compost metagenome]
MGSRSEIVMSWPRNKVILRKALRYERLVEMPTVGPTLSIKDEMAWTRVMLGVFLIPRRARALELGKCLA